MPYKISQEVEVDTELSGIDNVPAGHSLFMYFMIEDDENPGIYTGASCHVQWLDKDTGKSIIAVMDADLFVRGYYGAFSFDSQSPGVLNTTVKNLNADYDSPKVVSEDPY